MVRYGEKIGTVAASAELEATLIIREASSGILVKRLVRLNRPRPLFPRVIGWHPVKQKNQGTCPNACHTRQSTERSALKVHGSDGVARYKDGFHCVRRATNIWDYPPFRQFKSLPVGRGEGPRRVGSQDTRTLKDSPRKRTSSDIFNRRKLKYTSKTEAKRLGFALSVLSTRQ